MANEQSESCDNLLVYKLLVIYLADQDENILPTISLTNHVNNKLVIETLKTKTKIMYKALLSYPQLKEYLSALIENGLLDYQEAMQVYRTTDKGNRFLHVYNQLSELITTRTKRT